MISNYQSNERKIYKPFILQSNIVEKSNSMQSTAASTYTTKNENENA
jgi:hypothetical protein